MSDKMNSEMVLEFQNPEEPAYSFILEDNGVAGYAYLLKDGEVIARTWIYNRCAPPDELSKDAGKTTDLLPNAKPFLANTSLTIPTDAGEFSVDWNYRSGLFHLAILRIGPYTYGMLSPDFDFGWARLSRHDNPIARALGNYVNWVLDRREKAAAAAAKHHSA